MTRNHGHPQPVTPTLRGRVLGTELRRAREAAGLSITESPHAPASPSRP